MSEPMTTCPIGRLDTIADADLPDPCPVPLQRTATGTIADGVAAHLVYVHDMPKVAAVAVANYWCVGHASG